jgi:hypothetical protein
MHARLPRHRTAFVAAGALAVVLLATGPVGPAAAVDAHPRLARAVTEKRIQLNRDSTLVARRFAILEDDNLYPNATPDGRGAFLWYRGSAGRGAIYALEVGSTLWRAAVYGNIMLAWEREGWETGFGYPASDEYTPTRADIEDDGCPSNTQRKQPFVRADGVWFSACYAPGLDERSWPYSVYWTRWPTSGRR